MRSIILLIYFLLFAQRTLCQSHIYPLSLTQVSDRALYNSLGKAISVQGDLSLVGSQGVASTQGEKAGAAYFFSRQSDNSWINSGKLIPPDISDRVAFTQFGCSVSLDGHIAAIGACSNLGSVFIFGYNPLTETWEQQFKINPPYGDLTSRYGSAISLFGTTLAVGAPAARAGAGSAFIYERSENSSSWNLVASLDDGSTPGSSNFNNFGSSIALYSDTLVIGAPRTSTIFTRIGTAYVYQRDSTLQTWRLSGTLNADTSSFFGGQFAFGTSVAIDRNIIAVGAIVDIGITPTTGAAYIFTPSNNMWTLEAKIYASDGLTGYQFGQSIAVSPNYVVVGSLGGAGSVYVFHKNNGVWEQKYKFLPLNGVAQNNFGYAVSLSGTSLGIGVPDYNNPTSSGAVTFAFVECSTSNYGPTCAPCNCPETGICSDGIAGTGTCASCLPGFYGTNCDQPCICSQTQFCDDGPLGTGGCLSCDRNHFGVDCASTCTCLNGTCNSGISAAPLLLSGVPVLPGNCLACYPGFAGTNCDIPCSCVNGICNQNIQGDGTCSKCNTGSYGPYCNMSCSPTCVQNGLCSDGVNGTGACLVCKQGYFGSECSQPCACNSTGGFCAPTDGGLCSVCYNGHWGSDCSGTCSCPDDLICLSGINGNGSCINASSNQPPATICQCVHGACSLTGCVCVPGYYGTLCDQECDCVRGHCNDGVNGNGTCLSCDSGFYGTNCNMSCTCSSVGGVCNDGLNGDGTCLTCFPNYYDLDCNQLTQCVKSPSTCPSRVCSEGVRGNGACIIFDGVNSTSPPPSGGYKVTGATWVQRMLAYQRSLQFDIPLNSVSSWIVANNAHSHPNSIYNLNNTTPLIDLHPSTLLSQLHSVDTVLSLGARILDFSVNYLSEHDSLLTCSTRQFLYVACFGASQDSRSRLWCDEIGVSDLGETDSGCIPGSDRTWLDQLRLIANWLALAENSGEFVIVEIDWLFDSFDNTTRAAELLENDIKSLFPRKMIMKPYDYVTWPTLNMLSQDGRAIMFTCKTAICPRSSLVFPTLQKRTSSSIIDQQPTSSDNILPSSATYVQYFQFPVCSSSSPPMSLESLPFGRIEEDSTFLLTIWDGPTQVGVFDFRSAIHVMSCGLSLSFDRINLRKLHWSIWSWDITEPSAPFVNPTTHISQKRLSLFDENCAFLNYTSSRWQVMPCNASLPFACQSTSDPNTWIVTEIYAPAVPLPVNVCPPNFAFATPRSALDNFNILSSSTRLDNVWINVPVIDPITPTELQQNIADTVLLDQTQMKEQQLFVFGPNVPSVPPLVKNGTEPFDPRFCSLPKQATEFVCNWSQYEQTIAARQWGMILLFILGTLISLFLIIYIAGRCCHCQWGRRKYRFENDSDDDESGANLGSFSMGPLKMKNKFIFAFPAAFIIIGAFIIFVGDIYFTTSYNDGRNFLNARVNTIRDAFDSLSEALFNQPNIIIDSQATTILVEIAEGRAALSDHVVTFNAQTQAINVGRNFLIVIIVVVSLCVPLVGYLCGLKKNHARVLMVSLSLLVFVTFWTCFTIVIHGFESTVANDICHEVNTRSSMFDLWYAQYAIALADVSNALEISLATTGIQACTSFNSLCSVDSFQTCSNIICNSTTVPGLSSTTLIDTAEITTVIACSQSCDSTPLRRASVAFMASQTSFRWFAEKGFELVQDLQMGLLTHYGQELLQRIYCYDALVGYSLVVTGCSLLLIGQFLDLLFLISLSRN